MKITPYLYSAHYMLSTAAAALLLGPLSCNRQPQATHALSKTAIQSNKPAAAAAGASPATVTHAIKETLTKNASVNPAEPEQWIIGDNERIIPVVSSLEQHLLGAQEAQNSHNDKLIALELRAAAGSLQPERKNLIAPAKPDLLAATKNLNQLASQAEAGKTSMQILMKASIAAYDADMQNGFFTMQPDQWRKIYRYPMAHFTAARAALSKDMKVATTELRKVKSYLDVNAARANGTTRMSLDSRSVDIGNLANQVSEGKVKDPKELDRVATDAARALSELYYHNSQDAWQKHDAVTSAQWLTASIYNLRQSIDVSGMTIASSETNVLAATEAFAGSIHSNSNVDAKEMDNQLAQTGMELKKLVAMAKTTSQKSARVATLARSANAKPGTTSRN